MRIFLLSPAHCAGKRAGLLLGDRGGSALAVRLRSAEGATLGEIFAFMSGLYFRGKLAYASAFADPPPGCPGVQVIVPGLGLRAAGVRVDLEGLRAIARIPVDPDDPRFAGPLREDTVRLADRLGPADEVVLLGSIATPKYLRPLAELLGTRLRVPAEFFGLGDMSRGSLLLRRAAEGRELRYVKSPAPAAPAPRRGRRRDPAPEPA